MSATVFSSDYNQGYRIVVNGTGFKLQVSWKNKRSNVIVDEEVLILDDINFVEL